MSDLVKLQQSSDKLNSIALLRKEGGLSMDVVYVKLQKTVLDIFDYFGENLHSTQFDMVINDIENVGYMLNGADLDIFAANCKRGLYKNRVETIEGKEFAIKFFKLTPDVLIDWLKVYIFDRGEEFARLQAKPKIQGVSEVTAKYVELIKPFIKDVYEDKLKEKQDVKKTEPVLSPEDQYKKDLKDKVQSIYNEFKALQVEQNSRLVEVNGKFYDYNGYLKLRTT